MSGRLVALSVAALVAVVASSARAGGDDRESRARAHYEVGLGMYHLGNYRDAVREFTAGYDLSPRPEFLINLGQAYRKLNELDRAQEMFRKYLARAPADAPDRVQVRGLLAEVDAERAAAPPATSAPSTTAPATAAPTTAAPPTAEPSTTAPTASLPAAALPATTTAATVDATPRRHGLRRWWWTIPVGAAIVGAAVGVTLYFTLRSPQVSCANATIACLDLRP